MLNNKLEESIYHSTSHNEMLKKNYFWYCIFYLVHIQKTQVGISFTNFYFKYTNQIQNINYLFTLSPAGPGGPCSPLAACKMDKSSFLY